MEYKLMRLKDVGEFINGKAFKPSDWKKEGVPIVRIQNLNDSKKEYNYFQGECEEKYYLDSGDLLVSWSASLGVYIWNNGKAVLNQHIFKVKPKENIIDKVYLYYVLMTKINEIASKVHGSTMKHITKGQFEQTEIPVPSLEVQKKISKILHKAEWLKRRRESANNESEKIIPSLFYEIFGDLDMNDKDWEIEKLVEVLKKNENIVGGPFGSNLKVVDYRESGIPIMRLQNIGQAEFIDKNIKYISEEKAESLKYHSFKSGDIILAKLGETIGKSCIVPEKYSYGIVIGDVIRIRVPTGSCNKIFLLYFLNSKYCEKLLGDKVIGTTRPRVNLNDIRGIPFPCPPISIQNEFSQRVNQVLQIKQHQEKSTKKINHLFNSLLQEIFEPE